MPALKKQKDEKYTKFTEEELDIFTREARMIADQN